MNAAGECRPPERISALPCLPCGRSLRSCRQKVRAVFFGGALQGRSEAAGRGRPCCRRGPRCSALARAGGTAMLRQALFAEYTAFFLCFRCTLRFFLGGEHSSRRFPYRCLCRKASAFFLLWKARGFHTSPSSRKGASAAESLFPAYMPCCLREPMGIHEGVPGI